MTFTYRSARAEAEEMKKSLAAAHPERKFAAREVDLADRDAVEAFAGSLAKEPPYGGFVHNAGHTYDALAVMMEQAKAEVAMQVNYWSFTRLANVLVRPMMRAKDGRLAVIGSITALQANQGNAAYAASKAALLAYVRTLAIEVARTGVTVNYVAPGLHRYRHARALCQVSRRRRGADSGAAVRPARRDRRDRRLPDVARRVLSHRRGAAG